jgi:hypothetical protein
MVDLTVRSESVDVEQIMKQIRARIREKRGVDYSEDEIRELARVKLEKFLDPSKVRSELLEQYRKGRAAWLPSPLVVPPAPPNYEFDQETAYASSRGLAGRIIRLVRRLVNPLLKLFINPNPIIQVLHLQGEINSQSSVRTDRLVEGLSERLHRQDSIRAELDGLNYEVLHNLVVEVTRMSIEVKNLKMRVESLSSRLDFDERRARALEGVVLYRPGAGPVADGPPPAAAKADAPREEDPSVAPKGDALRSRRRRRRRGRPLGGGQPQQGGEPASPAAAGDDPSTDAGHDDSPDQGGSDSEGQ